MHATAGGDAEADVAEPGVDLDTGRDRRLHADVV